MEEKLQKARRAFCLSNSDSPYASVSSYIAGIVPQGTGELWWIDPTMSESDEADWRPVTYPLVRGVWTDGRREWKGQSVFEAGALGPSWLAFIRADAPPDRMVLDESGYIIPLWTERPKPGSTWLFTTHFSPMWPQLSGVMLESNRPVWNQEHPLSMCVDEEGWKWADASDPRRVREDLLTSPSRCAAWIMRRLNRGSSSLWQRLAEQEPALLTAIWRQVMPVEDELLFLDDDHVHVVSPTTWKAFDRVSPEALHYLPDPGPEWKLTSRSGPPTE